METTELALIGSLLIGYTADLIWADPEQMPHPIRWFGWLIAKGDKLLNHNNFRFIKGMLLTLLLLSLTYLSLWYMDRLLWALNSWVKIAFDALFVFWGIANKTLINEVSKVFKALKRGLSEGRTQVARIVGRDTSQLDEQEIKRAALESLSENLSDGVIAPLFFYALFGVPGIMTYKMVNTLDSMIGYNNDKYGQFGKFAALLDDVVNFIPARLTAALLSLSAWDANGWRFALKYGRAHKSPNSGYPEAALAGILNCRFGGPNYYGGQLVPKPYIGEKDKTLHDEDFNKALRLNHTATFIFILIIIVCHIIWNII